MKRDCHRSVAICAGLVAVLSLLAAPARAAPQCTVATDAQLSFGTIVALASTGDRTTDSAGSFWINCSGEVPDAPRIHSPGPRVMQSGSNQLPFKLSLVSPGSGDMPGASPGTVLNIARNGSNQVVPIYGKVRASDFKALPGGLYSASVVVTIEY